MLFLQLKSDAKEPFQKLDCSAVVKNVRIRNPFLCQHNWRYVNIVTLYIQNAAFSRNIFVKLLLCLNCLFFTNGNCLW